MKTFKQLFFENNAFIINSGLFEIKKNGLVNWLDFQKFQEFILNFIPNCL